MKYYLDAVFFWLNDEVWQNENALYRKFMDFSFLSNRVNNSGKRDCCCFIFLILNKFFLFQDVKSRFQSLATFPKTTWMDKQDQRKKICKFDFGVIFPLDGLWIHKENIAFHI